MSSPLLTIDVAHPPLHPDDVEAELLLGWSRVRNSSALHLIKIIHGYGSTGKGGSTKDLVRNWAYRNRKQFRMIIEGEEYNLYSASVQELRKEVGAYDDADLHNPNNGITVVWVK
jgi:hypothetical protein